MVSVVDLQYCLWIIFDYEQLLTKAFTISLQHHLPFSCSSFKKKVSKHNYFIFLVFTSQAHSNPLHSLRGKIQILKTQLL